MANNPQKKPAKGAGLLLNGGMRSFLTMTFIGPDRPGLVQLVAETIAGHGGNWLESRMAQLAGQFAGILRIEVDAAAAGRLADALHGLSSHGLNVQVVSAGQSGAPARRTLRIEVVGDDRPGIVRQLSAAVAGTGANVEELTTNLESAPMAGHLLFRATGTISLPDTLDPASLRQAIETLGDDLAVEIGE